MGVVVEFRLGAIWSGTHFVDAMNWLSRVIHGQSAGDSPARHLFGGSPADVH